MESLKEYLKPERGVKLETITYYNNINDPCIVLGPGLGGSAKKSSPSDTLIKNFVGVNYKVRIFSPRNSGGSTGHLTVGNYISDLGFVIRDSEYNDKRKPFVIGHSIGGYSLGRILCEKNNIEKAVLLAPLLDINEQNPWLLNKLLKLENKKARSAAFHSLNFINSLLVYLCASDQRFSDVEDAYEFAESLYSSPVCKDRMKVPTYIFLSGYTNMGNKIKDINKLKKEWKMLQSRNSKIEVYPDLDHYFSGFFIKSLGGGRAFMASETEEIIKKIDSFFRS